MVRKRASRTKQRAAPAKEPLVRWDAVDGLKSETDIAAYLGAAMAEAGDDSAYIATVLGDIAEARDVVRRKPSD